MALPVVFRRKVGRNLAGAYGWHEEQRPGLGVEFLRLTTYTAWPTRTRSRRRANSTTVVCAPVGVNAGGHQVHACRFDLLPGQSRLAIPSELR